jgi:class 3 adenylate cyclase
LHTNRRESAHAAPAAVTRGHARCSNRQIQVPTRSSVAWRLSARPWPAPPSALRGTAVPARGRQATIASRPGQVAAHRGDRVVMRLVSRFQRGKTGCRCSQEAHVTSFPDEASGPTVATRTADAAGERPPSAGRGEQGWPGFPFGTVTILMTDIEGSTRLWETEPAAMEVALQRHDRLLIEVIGQHGGTVVTSRGEGDSFFARNSSERTRARSVTRPASRDNRGGGGVLAKYEAASNGPMGRTASPTCTRIAASVHTTLWRAVTRCADGERKRSRSFRDDPQRCEGVSWTRSRSPAGPAQRARKGPGSPSARKAPGQ